MRYFVLGLKGTVEIRASNSPPKAVRSALEGGSRRIWDWRRAVYREQKTKVELLTFSGGQLLGSPIRARKFAALTGHSLKPGTVWEIKEETAQKLLERRAGP